MTTVDVPTAVHIGADELPFVDIGDGTKLKVIQVKEAEGLWIVENVFQAGYEVQRHKHTGPVYAYTTSGAWKYKEYDYVNRAGSFLYEPAGSVHTLQCHRGRHPRLVPDLRGEPEPRRRRQHRERRSTGPAPSRPTSCCARPRACPGRTSSRLIMSSGTAEVDLGNPDTFVDGVPHEALAELRRTDPVHWQPMDGEPGFWAVLRHADVGTGCPPPRALLGQRGRRRPRESVAGEPRDDAQHAAGDGPARPHRAPRAAVATLPGQGHRRDSRTGSATICRAIMAEALEQGEVEFVHEVTSRLPTRVIGELFGLPPQDWDLIHELAERNTSDQDPDIADAGPRPPASRWRCMRSSSPPPGAEAIARTI